MNSHVLCCFALAALLALSVAIGLAAICQAQEISIRVDAPPPAPSRGGEGVGGGHRVSRYLTGACIEDVNHEIYGGIYSQMVFGEHFQEPAPAVPPKGFRAYGGSWQVQGQELLAGAGDGPKLISGLPAFAEGEAGVELLLPDKKPGNAGFIVKVTEPGIGADSFNGYEITLDAAGHLVLGRHRQNWEPIRNVACEVPINQWISLVVKMTRKTLEVLVNGKSVVSYEDTEHPLEAGQVGLRPWQREARFRNLWVKTGGSTQTLPFEALPQSPPPPREGAGIGGQDEDVSGMWRCVRRGGASGSFALEREQPFAGVQSQRVTFGDGEGEIGIENRGLNRWGMSFIADRTYEGLLWARVEKPLELSVALESGGGENILARKLLKVKAGGWQPLEFTLKPKANEKAGRFVISLQAPGSVVLGYASLQPGVWGRFKGLPDRRDVVEALLDQGITVLRYGGSMVNHEQYRWKKMLGPRERRPPYKGTWYACSSNGWGIVDFVELCEAAGFLGIPAFNMGETPQDMADFVEYVNGPAGSEWGRQRAAAGHPKPYKLTHLELGNEERVDDTYYQKFKALAEAIWAKDSGITIVVGDFVYSQLLTDPMNFKGAASGITSLAAHQRILQLAKAHEREVWFDVHLGTNGPVPDSTLPALPTFIDSLAKVAAGARHKVVVFELNAGNPSQRRALANAIAINTIERDGRVPIVTSANCLQPDGQNDNGWDQGLLFLNPSQVWLQPPGYVTRMLSRNYQPVVVGTEVRGADGKLDVTAKRSEDGRTLVLQVVNVGGQPAAAAITLGGFTPRKPAAWAEELCGPLEAVNTAQEPNRLRPRESEWKHGCENGVVRRTFPPYSFTVLRFE